MIEISTIHSKQKNNSGIFETNKCPMMMTLATTVYIFIFVSPKKNLADLEEIFLLYILQIYIYILSFPYLLTSCPVPAQTGVTGPSHYLPTPRSSGRTAVPATQAEEPRGECDIKGVLGENPTARRACFFFRRKDPSAARFGVDVTLIVSHQIQFGRKKSSNMIQDGLKNTLRVGIHQQS